jgi:hypothetical protein
VNEHLDEVLSIEENRRPLEMELVEMDVDGRAFKAGKH